MTDPIRSKGIGTRCQFAEFDGGLFFTLTEFEELKDVRLVYAPPLGVGNYGGDADNWSWPRHTGDFSLLRAYKNREPYRPRYFFPVSTEGVREGDAWRCSATRGGPTGRGSRTR